MVGATDAKAVSLTLNLFTHINETYLSLNLNIIYMRLNVKALHLVCLLLFLMSTSHSLLAQNQQYFIEGKVTSEVTGEPLIGATVSLVNTLTGTVTDVEGNYSISPRLTPGEYTLAVTYVGFQTYRAPLTLGTEETIVQDVALGEDAVNLDEVVVTGNTVATSRRQLGNAISTVGAETLEETGAIAVDQALAGKVSGALIQQNSGDPAGGISIRLRGPSTITGSSDPLYIVDGVIVNNSSTQVIDLGGNTQNRLVDINPNDIERIEVIKGAAAAAIYGSRASNGVVQIFTKKGKTGKPRLSFSTGIRYNELRKEIDYNDAPVRWENPFDNNDLTTVPTERFNLQDGLFESALGTDNNISVRGGTDKTKYYISGTYNNNPGIVKNTNFERYGARINVDQVLSDWASFNLGVNYINSSSQDIPNGGIASAYGAITGFLFSETYIDPSPNESGVYPVTSLLVPRTNPLEAVNRFEFGQRTNRAITSLAFNLFPVEGLNINYVLGLDAYNQSGTSFIPVGNTSPNATGFASRAEANVSQFNNDLNISYNANLTRNITSTTVVGGTWQQERFERLGLASDRLAPTVKVASGGTIIGQSDSRSEVSYWGAFAQETFGIADRLFLTGAIRLDGASVFGEDDRNQLFGKASASYVLSDENFWKNSLGNFINTFKLRASWGEAGNLTALGAFDRFSNYNAIAINGVSGVVPSSLLGNANLRPERQTEVELGFDMALVNNRIGVEFTYYQQNVEDLLLQRELSPSTGFGTRFENVGALENEGIELLLNIAPVRTTDFNWDITATYTSNENTVTQVVGDRITLPGSFATSFVIPGEPLGVFYRQFYARDANGDIIYDANGYPSRGETEDGQASKVIGDPNPDWFGSLINDFTYRKLRLRVQFDAVQGFDVFNWNRRLLDNVIFGGGSGVADELRGDAPKGLGRAEANIFEEFVEDGSFVKLRELSLSYTINPKKNFENIEVSLIGRNLLSFDDYTGWDPEINTPGQSNGVRGFDFAGVPIPRSYMLSLRFDL